jgi:hypothetical protein
MKETVVECIKNAKDVLDAVGPVILEHDKTYILTQGVASARNWCELVLKEQYPGWHMVSEDGFPAHDRPVAIFPSFHGHEFACWNEKCDSWDSEDGDDYMCDKDAVAAWFEIPIIPDELKNKIK